MTQSDDRSSTSGDGNSSSARTSGPTAAGAGNSEQAKAVRHEASTGADRDGFGDDMGTRVGRPDAGRSSADSSARLSENATASGLEGAILDGGDNARSQSASASSSSAAGDRSRTRADGSSMSGEEQHEGRTLDHAQRAQSGTPQQSQGSGDSAKGAGAEASRGVEGAQVQGGSDEAGGERSGSEPLEGRTKEHKGSYGGEGGAPRTSSDQRERPGSGS